VTSDDGTVRIERLDQSAECDGLLPVRAPDARRASIDDDPAPSCGPGLSEGGGHVAVLSRYGAGWQEWLAFAPNGAREERFSVHSALFPQPDGWAGARADARMAPYGAVDAQRFFPDGTPRGDPQRVTAPPEGSMHQWDAAEDPLGGMVLTWSWHMMDGSGACGGGALRLDEAGAPRGPAAEIACWSLAVGVSTRGDALVLEQGEGRIRVHWIRPDGADARDLAFLEPAGLFLGRGVELFPLLDGALAVNEGGLWTRRFAHLADRPDDAPAWLADHPGTTFRFTRGNRGYAVFPRPGASSDTTSPDCSQAVELRAPSGRLCGRVTLLNPGGPCRTGQADQGWDGTVVEKDGRAPCAWRWWPRLLARD
jgi:hypothetical protein